MDKNSCVDENCCGDCNSQAENGVDQNSCGNDNSQGPAAAAVPSKW